RMTVDRYIVGRIGEHRSGALVRHQHGESLAVQSIAARQPMATKEPHLAYPAERRTPRVRGQIIRRVILDRRRILERGNPQIDLGDFEADDLEIEIEP